MKQVGYSPQLPRNEYPSANAQTILANQAAARKPQKELAMQQMTQMQMQMQAQQVVPPAVSETLQKETPGTSSPLELSMMGFAHNQGYGQGVVTGRGYRRSPLNMDLMGFGGDGYDFGYVTG